MGVATKTYAKPRAFPRAPGTLTGGWSGTNTPCRISSLSLSGCFVESQAMAKKDERVRVEIELPEQGRVSVPAAVVYQEAGMGFALRFLEVPSDVLDKLSRAIEFLFAESQKRPGS